MRPLMCGMVLVFAASVLACGGAGTKTAPKGADTKTVYSRDEFRKLLMGKSQDEVLRAVGAPDTTQDSGRHQSWYYRERTTDPITGKMDSSAQVWFERGIVESINY